jgi:hypothetical protein
VDGAANIAASGREAGSEEPEPGVRVDQALEGLHEKDEVLLYATQV